MAVAVAVAFDDPAPGGDPVAEVAIAVEDLSKRYGDVAAVDGVSLEVFSGECFGILGPNGAGKTTTLEMIEGLREPDSGSVRVLGESPWPRNRHLLPRMGVQLQAGAFIEKQTVGEQIRTFADLYGAPRERADELLDRVGLGATADRETEALSGGQQQRLSIALALVHQPELVFLDEPSAGLDPTARRALWDVLQGIRSDGTTVVLTTHYMEEAEVLCDRVAIMDAGRLLELGAPAELVRALGAPSRVQIPPESIPEDLAAELPGVEHVELEPGAMALITRNPATVLAALAERDALGGLQVHSATLEDVFVALTGKRLGPGERTDSDPTGALGGRRTGGASESRTDGPGNHS